MQINKRIRGSFDHPSFGVLLVVSAFAVFGSSLLAATVTKADNTANLNVGSSWVGGVPPAPVDILLWNSTVTGANTVSLGVPNLLIGTLRITNPGGPVTLNGIGTLQLGAAGIPRIGIDMSSATADLTINANIALEDTPIDSTWTVAAGRTLTITGNVSENGPANKILTITGAGTTRITGIISDDKKEDLSLVKSGTGTLILAAANTYSGDTTVNQGVLNLRNSSALGVTKTGSTIVNAGGELQLQGNISIASGENISLTGTGAGGLGSAALRNISGGNQLNGPVILQDVLGVTRINSDSGSLTLLGDISEANTLRATENKILTFGGTGDVIVIGQIKGKATVSLAKDGTGTLELTGNNSYQGATVISGGTVIIRGGNGDIQSSASVTINNATLSLDNTLANKNDRIGNGPLTMNSGTFNYIHSALGGTNYTETIGPLTLGSGKSTIRTDASAPGNSSILTFGSLARSAGATVNFGGGTSNPSAANDDNNVRITGQTAGLIGAWATVGGTSFATYNTASATDSVEALTVFDQTVTRLSSGTKNISAANPANNVQITDGTGAAGNLTLGAATTTVFTLTNNATGLNAPAGGVTIDPAGRTLQVNGILNAANASALTIGNGTNNGTLTANTAGGELILLNFSSNALAVNSVIANNNTASTLIKAGTGTLSLTAANTYTGGTLLSGGTVNFSGSGVLPTVPRNGAGVVSSNGVNFNGGSLVLGANNLGSPASDLTLGKLTLSGTSTLDLGATAGTPRFIVFGGFTYLGGSLTILNSAAQAFTAPTTGGRLLFSKDSFTELGSTALEGIIFQGFGGGSASASATAVNFDANYFELVPIPEPATILGAFSLLGLVAYRERQTIRRLAKA